MSIDARFSFGALALLLALPINARADSAEAQASLAAALAGPERPYAGEVRIVAPGRGGKMRESFLSVRADGPLKRRRETVDKMGWPKVLRVSDGKTEWLYDRARASAWRGTPSDPDLKLIDPDEELALIARNYEVRSEPAERVAGRRCEVVSLLASGGVLSRRLWIDAAESLILRRVHYGAGGKELSRMEFTSIDWTAKIGAEDFSFTPPAGTQVQERSLQAESMPLDEAALATGLAPRLPSWLPPGFALESVNLIPRGGLTVLHYRFSDGLEVLSLFQAPKQARLKLDAGYAVDAEEPPAVAGGKARRAIGPEGTLLEWLDGDRFWLLGALPSRILTQVAQSLGGKP